MIDTFARESTKRNERRKARLRASRLMEEAASGAPLSSETGAYTDRQFGFLFDGFDDDTVDCAELGPASSSSNKIDAATTYLFDPDPDIGGGEHPYNFPHIKISRSWDSLEDAKFSGHIFLDPPGFDPPVVSGNRNGKHGSRKGLKGKPLLASTGPFLVGLMSGIMLIVAYLQLTGGHSSMKSSLTRQHEGGRPMSPIGNVDYISGPEINVIMEEKGRSKSEGTSEATTSSEELTGSIPASKQGSEPKAIAQAASPSKEQIDETTEIAQQRAQNEEEFELADFCDTCQWKDSAFTCKSRVHWLTKHYNVTEIEAKRNNLKHCTVPVDEIAESILAKFCDTCQWKSSAFSCAWRVQKLTEHFNMTEIEAKNATLKYCMAPNDESADPGVES